MIRLQLWGEAAHYQSQGESLVLDPALWGEAGIAQEARRQADPWEDVLREMPKFAEVREFKDGSSCEREVRIIYNDSEAGEERVAASDILQYLLKIPPGLQKTADAMRLGVVMRKLGWSRPDNGNVTIDGKRVKGYFKRVEQSAAVQPATTFF